MSTKTRRADRIKLTMTAIVAGALAMPASTAVASGYTYKQIVDNSGYGFTTLGSGHRQLNESGEVTFQAIHNASFSNFVYKGSGGNLTTIAGPPVFFGLNSGYGNGTITDNGSVVFTGTAGGSQGEILNGIYVDNAGTKTPLIISEADPNTNLPERLFYAASTSPSGVIAFLAARFDFPDQASDEINNGYYLLTGQGLVTLAEDGGTYDSAGGLAPIVNDAGQVAFLMSESTGTGSSNTILRYDSGSLTTIKSNFSGGHEIWMNSAGDVIYADATHVKLYSAGVTTTIASTDDGFHSLNKSGNSDVFINDLDEVAFWGNVTSFNGQPVQRDGIYTGTDLIEDRVVVRGDTVLGHLVGGTEALGLNNAGQILLSVEAQSPDPWRALVVATPVPEGDFQEDADVDIVDFAIWKSNFGLATNARHNQGDADDDNDVDGRDFLIWQRQFGTPAPSLAAVPEPGAATLIAATLGTSLAAGGRRSRRTR